MMLDTLVGYQVGESEWQEARPLDRILYLREFDCFVPATYTGAPPVCHFCRRGGHVRAKCPELAKRKCFGCNKHGHIIRVCPEGKKADYLKKPKMSHVGDESEESEDRRKAQEGATKLYDYIDQQKLGEGR